MGKGGYGESPNVEAGRIYEKCATLLQRRIAFPLNNLRPSP